LLRLRIGLSDIRGRFLNQRIEWEQLGKADFKAMPILTELKELTGRA